MQDLLKPKKDWEAKKLGDCLKQNPDYGINAAAVPYTESLPVYLRITDITDDGRYSKKNVVSVNNIASSSYYLETGDLVSQEQEQVLEKHIYTILMMENWFLQVS